MVNCSLLFSPLLDRASERALPDLVHSFSGVVWFLHNILPHQLFTPPNFLKQIINILDKVLPQVSRSSLLLCLYNCQISQISALEPQTCLQLHFQRFFRIPCTITVHLSSKPLDCFRIYLHDS